MIKLKNIISENFDQNEIETLKGMVQKMNDLADKRYAEIYNASLGRYTDPGDDPHAHTMFGQPSNVAHQNALQDHVYQDLKRDARKMEDKLRKVEKRIKQGAKKKRHTPCPYCRAYGGGPCPYCRAYNN